MLRKMYVCLMLLMLMPAGAVGQQEELSQDIGKTNSPCGGGHLHQCPEDGESQKLHSDPSSDSWKQGDVHEEAVSMYLKMAEHNNCDAQFLMCRIYREGERIPKDLSKAIFWCSEAGRQECLSSTGGPAAALMLAILYHYGEEMEALVDAEKAFFWYSRVLQGEGVPENIIAISASALAYLYESGQGTPRDLAKALSLYKTAAEHGHEAAKAKLREYGIKL